MQKCLLSSAVVDLTTNVLGAIGLQLCSRTRFVGFENCDQFHWNMLLLLFKGKITNSFALINTTKKER